MPQSVKFAVVGPHSSLWQDYKKIFLLAYPVVLSNAVDQAMMMIDRLFLARVNAEAGSEVILGGAIGGGAITWLLQAPLLGLLLYTNPMSSQNFGRGDLPRCTQVAAQAMYWALVYYPLILLCSSFIPKLLAWVGHDPALAEAEWAYARVLLGGSLFALLRIPLSSFFISSNRSNLVMRASFIGVLLNIPLDYWFIFDAPLGFAGLRPSQLGLPVGIAGAAFATVCVQLLVFLLLLAAFLGQKPEYRVARCWRLRSSIHAELLRFGLPVSLESLLKSVSYNIFLILFNSISPVVAAAATITFSWDQCNFVILLGIGTATATLVGQSLGAGNIAQARRFTRLILLAALLLSSFISLWFLLAPTLLISVFITAATADSEQLFALSKAMLRLAALYLLADAVGVVMRGALSGAKDTLATMLLSAILHLGLLLGSILLLKVFHFSALQVWASFVIFLWLANGALGLRYLSGRWERHWRPRPPLWRT